MNWKPDRDLDQMGTRTHTRAVTVVVPPPPEQQQHQQQYHIDQNPSIHWLPFRSDASCVANVSSFFIVNPLSRTETTTTETTTTTTSTSSSSSSFSASSSVTARNQEPLQHFESSFRGRLLRGTKVHLHPSTRGVVLQEVPSEKQDNKQQQQQQQQQQEEEEKENMKELKVVGTFREFLYWKREAAPQEDDPVLQSLTFQWLDIANSIHSEISQEQVLASKQRKLEKLSQSNRPDE